MTHPSGEQWTIRHGDQQAVLTEVGGTLRSYTVAGEPVVAGYDIDEVCPHCRGQVLAPWPNRIRDGAYTWDGSPHQLALTEPERGNATHGLVAWLPWRLVEHAADAVTLAVRLHPQPGWAWTLDLQARWSLDDDGLTCTTSATNLGPGDTPFGYGAHPYLTVGEQRVDDVLITVPAERWCEVDDDRLLPVAATVDASTRAVEGTSHDLRGGGPLGDRVIDAAFTGLPDRWVVRLEGPQRVAELWADAATFPWLQVFTGDALPEEHRRTSGIAVEPLTCAPNAFATGEDVLRLAPGATWNGTWGLRVRPTPGGSAGSLEGHGEVPRRDER